MNLGEEIIERYKNDWFIVDTTMMVGTGNGIVADTHYVQFQDFHDGFFEVVDINWNMSRLVFRMINEVGKFSKLSTVKDPELIEKLNKAKRKLITKQSIKNPNFLLTTKMNISI